MTVSAVVVTYNRLSLLKEVIAALQESQTLVNHIIVVDNASDQDTQAYLNSLAGQICYVRLTKNLGGAGGFNRGIRYFMEETNDDYVWLMDDDTVVKPDTLTKLVNFADSKQQFGFLASDVRWIDGQRALMNLPAPLNRLQVVPENPVVPIELRSATFVSILFARSMVATIGLPITDFFIWGDDIEYTERARRVAPGYLVPAAQVVHKMSQNIGSDIIKDSKARTNRYYYAYRNKLYYARQRNSFGYFKGQVRILLETMRLIFWPKKVENRWGKVKVILQAVHDGRKFNPPVEFAKKHEAVK